jgi:hypothetical protein
MNVERRRIVDIDPTRAMRENYKAQLSEQSMIRTIAVRFITTLAFAPSLAYAQTAECSEGG